jgi:hypothetical protein
MADDRVPVANAIARHKAGWAIAWRRQATWVIEEVLATAEHTGDAALARKARAALARRSS